MTPTETANLQFVRDYLRAVEGMATGDALARFYTPDAVQVELPSALNPNGGRSDLSTLLKRAEMVPNLLRTQHYEIVSEMARDNRVCIEATWTAVLAVPFGKVVAGTDMKAHFAMFFEIKDGRIRSQRNYDCFEPWEA